jgi:hypothetical protein
MKKNLVILLLGLAGCALRPSWHWEKPGASEEQYTSDLNHCKGVSYPGADGMVTGEMVRRMHACMEAHGWHKVGVNP